MSLADLTGANLKPAFEAPWEKTSPFAWYPRHVPPWISSFRLQRFNRPFSKTLESLLNKRTPKLVRLLHNTWNANREAVKFEEWMLAFQRGIATDSMREAWRANYVSLIKDHLEKEWQEIMQKGGKALRTSVVVPSLARFLSEEPVLARSLQFVEERRKFLADLWTDKEVEGLADAVSNLTRLTLLEDLHTDELAKRLRAMVGLTKKQRDQLIRLEENLIGQGVKPERRLDILESTRARLIRQRAETIARQEISTAFHFGIQSEVEEASRALKVPMVKVYRTARDELVCPICAPMDGQKIGVDEAFPANLPDADASKFPPIHLGCRCTIDFEVVKQ
jgi:hypothetical protein